ncbi:MAG: 2OG-Fe(II) oxygenase [Myxococcota bacterium]|nr:2OG-Fe(II) oxygenase [Myxococcota bacterium]
MDRLHTERIAHWLRAMESPGAVAASVDLACMGLALTVEGVGRSRLPLTDEFVDGLIQEGRPSPFGRRDQTLHDETVRRSSEVLAAQIELSSGWERRLKRAIQQLKERLEIRADVEVEASLQKLIVYEPGGFFAPHRDTELDERMWGSLVVVLPTEHEGGALVVRHGGRTERFELGALAQERRLGFVAFYADCVHEIEPVQGGRRVSLTFALRGRVRHAPRVGADPSELGALLERYFESEERLVVMLDHVYTEQRFGWDRLRLLDAERVGALRACAEDLGLRCALAFVDVREAYEYVDGEEGGEGGTLEGQAVNRDAFEGLLERELRLVVVFDGAGQRIRGMAGPVEARQVISLMSALERNPYSLSAEPWNGNEGGTAEQWYHQAAVVLVRE